MAYQEPGMDAQKGDVLTNATSLRCDINKPVKQTSFILLFIFVCFTKSFAQKKDLVKIADSITNEGRVLFRSEWASWYGTDIFMDKCKNKRDQVGGYISYDTGEGLNNIFFSKGPDPVVLGTTSFGYDFNADNYKSDTVNRKLTPAEMELYTIRQTGLKRINSDTIFKRFNNTNLNLVPIVNNGTKRVYVLTGPTVSGVVVIGNDYLIDFDDQDSIKTVKRLHKNIIPITYSKATADSNKTVLASMHTHLRESGDFITAADICTLMLYEKFTTWNQHIVTSQRYASIWDCKSDKLVILSIEDWKKGNPLKRALEVSKDH